MNPATKAQLVAGFYKALPALSALLVARGVMTQDQSTAFINGAPEALAWLQIVAGLLGGIWTGVYSWWANRREKKIADVQAMPEATVKVSDPALAAKVDKITSATTPTVAPQ